MKVAFHQPHLSERGTTVAMFDYAFYNEIMLTNQSYIIIKKHHTFTNQAMYDKFKEFFTVFEYTSFDEVDDFITSENISCIYHIKYGTKDDLLSKKVPNLNHFVFECEPHGETYAMVSEYLGRKYNTEYVPHIVNRFLYTVHQKNKFRKEFRETHNIPETAFVFGRHGGKDTFSIYWVKEVIVNVVNMNPNIYFVFVNTDKFHEHKQIIYINTIVDNDEKNKYICACDAMIHARDEGETFGLAIAEFSAANKPVLTTRSYKDNCHIEILGDKGVIYNNRDDLFELLMNPGKFLGRFEDWNAYGKFSPGIVMQKFKKVFLDSVKN